MEVSNGNLLWPVLGAATGFSADNSFIQRKHQIARNFDNLTNQQEDTGNIWN